LSDDTSSTVDEALIGEWSWNMEGDDGQEKTLGNLFIGRKDKAKNTLEIVGTSLDEQQHVRIDRWNLFTTRVGDQCLMSVPHSLASDDADSKDFDICLYEQSDHDTVNVHIVDIQVVDAAVLHGQLPGDVVVRRGFIPQRHVERVTATADEWRDYLAKVGKRAFDTSFAVAILRRVRRPDS
jgi:hypothetical protein